MIFVRLADTVISSVESPGGFDCAFEDVHSGKCTSRTLTNVQLGAIIALALGGEDYTPELTTELYKIAEPAVAGFPNEVRPIP